MLDEARSKVGVDDGANLGSQGRFYPIRHGGDGFAVEGDPDLEGNGGTMAKIRLGGGESVSVLKEGRGKGV